MSVEKGVDIRSNLVILFSVWREIVEKPRNWGRKGIREESAENVGADLFFAKLLESWVIDTDTNKIRQLDKFLRDIPFG